MISPEGEVNHELIDWSSLAEIYTKTELCTRIENYNNTAQDQVRLYRSLWMKDVMTPNSCDEYEYYGTKLIWYLA